MYRARIGLNLSQVTDAGICRDLTGFYATALQGSIALDIGHGSHRLSLRTPQLPQQRMGRV